MSALPIVTEFVRDFKAEYPESAKLVEKAAFAELRDEFLKTIEQHEMEYLSFTHGDVELITALFDKAIKNLER